MSRCPRCHAGPVVDGTCENSYRRSYFGGGANRFSPRDLKALSFQNGIPLRTAFRACAGCGLVWNEVATQELRRFAARHGGKRLQDTLRGDTDAPHAPDS